MKKRTLYEIYLKCKDFEIQEVANFVSQVIAIRKQEYNNNIA